MLIFALIFAVICIFCAIKESSVTGLYKAFGVYGRIKAYLAMDFTLAGALMLILFVGSFFHPEMKAAMEEMDAGGSVVILGMALILLVIGILLYWTSLRKCPEMLKSKCIISMIITGLGVTFKLAIFFIFSVWKLTGPEEVVSETGESLFIIGNEVYDGSGSKVGYVNEGGDSFTRIR